MDQMDYSNSKHEIAIIANLAISMIIRGIRDYKLSLPGSNGQIVPKNRFEEIKAKVNNEYAKEAIAWFEGNIENCGLPFATCCEILQSGLAQKTAVRTAITRNNLNPVINPHLLALRIFNTPDKMIKLLEQLDTMFRDADLSADEKDAVADEPISFINADDFKYFEAFSKDPVDSTDEDLVSCLDDNEDNDIDEFVSNCAIDENLIDDRMSPHP